MGHRFCRSHWKVFPALDGKPGEELNWHETPCFQYIKGNYNRFDYIETKLLPSFSHNTQDYIFPCTLTPERALQYIADVQTALPGVVEIRELPTEGPYVFRYSLRTPENYMRFLGVASLMRYVEEFWVYVQNYHDMRKEGIPIDVALFCCSLVNEGEAFVGHGFSPSLGNLKSLKNFSLERIFLRNPRIRGRPEGNYLWSLLTDYNEHFAASLDYKKIYPLAFRMTRDIYEAFCKDTSRGERIRLINQQGGLSRAAA